MRSLLPPSDRTRWEDRRRPSPDRAIAAPLVDLGRVGAAVVLLLPAGLIGYLAFNSGGFYPGAPAYAALVLCLALLLRMAFASDPFEGMSWALAVPAAAMALFTGFTLASQAWSHAPGLALTEFALPLVYLLTLVLFGSFAVSRERLGWTLRLLGATILVICTCGLITRILPHVWPIAPELANNRLSFPVTYWNALGVLAGFGVVICAHLTSDLKERAYVRALAAAAIPVLLVTLYFTFSRGAIAVTVVAIVVYSLFGRPRGLLTAVLASAPAGAVGLAVAYGANRLATTHPTVPGAVSQGHRVAIVLLACVVGAAGLRLLLLPLDWRLERLTLPRRARRYAARGGWAALGAVVLIIGVGFRGTISREYQRFVSPARVGNGADLRSRLTDPGNNGRLDLWRVALHGFESKPLVGNGAGTFADTWTQKRPTRVVAVDAHSLYLEVLDELGLVGLVLLLAVVVTALQRAARRIRGPDRPLHAAVFAVMLAWAIHAGVDWDWEMPVVTIVFFVLAGCVLARQDPPLLSRVRSWLVLTPQRRALLGLGCILLGVAPMYIWLSQRKLDQASAAYSAGNCEAATRAALSSISVVGTRADPYEILAYCDVKRGMPRLALAAIHQAISLDSKNSDYAVDLALIQAAAGMNPLNAAKQALALDPRDPDVQQVWQTFKSDSPGQWPADGQQFINTFNPA